MTSHEPSQPEPRFRWELSIDFGTSTTKIGVALVVDGERVHKPIMVELEGSVTTSSAVAFYRDEFGQETVCYGEDLMAKIRDKEVECKDVFQYIKLCLYDEYEAREPPSVVRVKQQLKEHPIYLEDLIHSYFVAILGATRHWLENEHPYRTQIKQKLSSLRMRVRLTCPQLWSPTARRIMQQAVLRADANIENVEMASEPICTLAALSERLQGDLANRSIETSEGDNFMLVDTGCGTVDIVLFRQVGKLGQDTDFKALRQCAGCLGGSQQVNELIRNQILKNIDAQQAGGVDAECRRLGITNEHFKYCLDKQIETAKIDYAKSTTKRHMISVPNEGSGLPFFCYISANEIEEALDPVIQDIVKQIQTVEYWATAKFILLSGGFSLCLRLRRKLQETFKNATLIPLSAGSSPTLVAEGALSDRYEAINCRDLPSSVSYAMVRMEEFSPEHHPDCVAPGTSQDPRPGKVSDNPYDEDDGSLWVVGRLKILLGQGQVGGGKITSDDQQIFAAELQNPKIEVRLVYFRGEEFRDHDSALRKDHVVSDEKQDLRPGVKEWKRIETVLDTKLLKQHGFEKTDGGQCWRVPCRITFIYEKEQSIQIYWTITDPKGNIHQVHTDSAVWHANSSEFFTDGETYEDRVEVVDAEPQQVQEEEGESAHVVEEDEQMSEDDGGEDEYQEGDGQVHAYRERPLRSGRTF